MNHPDQPVDSADSDHARRSWLPQLLVFVIFCVIAIGIAVNYEVSSSDETAEPPPRRASLRRERATQTAAAMAAVATASEQLPTPSLAAPLSPTSTRSTLFEEPTATTTPVTTPRAVPTPTMRPSPTNEMTATLEPGMALRAQLAQAESRLRSGVFDAVIDYGDGTQATASVVFDLGDEVTPPRMHMVASYGGSSDHTIELITIGSQTWQRQGTSPWTVDANREGVWGQVQSLLPRAENIPVSAQPGQTPGTLVWFDPSRNDDVTLTIDLESGIPLELRQTSRDTTTVVIVRYTSWDIPVTIDPPIAE